MACHPVVLEQLYNHHIAGMLVPQDRMRLHSYMNQLRMCRCLNGMGIIIIVIYSIGDCQPTTGTVTSLLSREQLYALEVMVLNQIVSVIMQNVLET